MSSSSRWAAAARPEPELVETPPTVEELVARSQAGRHAASDHLEIAALAGVPTIGCRRAGGGLAGGVAVSNVAGGARLAAELRPDLVLFDGSGAAIPPIATARRVLVTGTAARDPYFDTYRRLVSDLVVERPVLRAAPDRAARGPGRRLHGRRDRRLAPRGRHRPRIGEPVRPRAPPRTTSWTRTRISSKLKAAGIDVVATHALARGIRVVLAGNDVSGVDDDALLALAPVGVA